MEGKHRCAGRALPFNTFPAKGGRLGVLDSARGINRTPAAAPCRDAGQGSLGSRSTAATRELSLARISESAR